MIRRTYLNLERKESDIAVLLPQMLRDQRRQQPLHATSRKNMYTISCIRNSQRIIRIFANELKGGWVCRCYKISEVIVDVFISHMPLTDFLPIASSRTPALVIVCICSLALTGVATEGSKALIVLQCCHRQNQHFDYRMSTQRNWLHLKGITYPEQPAPAYGDHP